MLYLGKNIVFYCS